MTANQATSILSCGILSVLFLSERFSPKYDLSSWIVIFIGCTLIIHSAHKEKLDEDHTYFIDLALRPINFIFIGSLIVLLIIDLALINPLVERKANLFLEDAKNFVKKSETEPISEELKLIAIQLKQNLLETNGTQVTFRIINRQIACLNSE